MLNLLSSNPVEKNNSLLVYDEHFNKLHFVLEVCNVFDSSKYFLSNCVEYCLIIYKLFPRFVCTRRHFPSFVLSLRLLWILPRRRVVRASQSQRRRNNKLRYVLNVPCHFICIVPFHACLTCCPNNKCYFNWLKNAGLTLKKPYVQLQEVMLNKTEELSTFLMNAYVPTKDQGFDGLLEQKAYLDELVGSSFLQVAFSECYSTMLTNVTESYAVQIEEMRKLSTSLVEYVRNFEL